MNNKNDVKIKNYKKRTKLSRIAVPRKERLGFSCNFFIAFVIISILIIVVVNTTAIFCVCFPEVKEKMFSITLSDTAISAMSENDNIRKPKSNNEDNSENKKSTELTDTEKVESTLLSSGIAIISVAIAVWAGLNIIKALEKNNFKQLSMDVKKNNDERKRLAIDTLLNNIEGLDDELNRYLYKSLSEIEFNYQIIDAEFFSQINTVETWFQGLYKKHYQNGKIIPENYNSVIEIVNELLPKTKELPKQIQSKTQLYLNIRCAEIHFYLGFCGSNIDIYDHMTRAIEKYCESFPLMKQLNYINIKKSPFTDDIILNTYLLNTIGQAHSEIVFKCAKILTPEELAQYKSKTMNFFDLMIGSLNIHDKISAMQRELYYRDYGCALERVKGVNEETIIKIANAYERALSIFLTSNEAGKKNYNVFKVYISLFHKYCDNIFVCKKDNLKELINLNNLKSSANSAEYKKIKELKDYTSKRKIYIEMATIEYAHSLEFIKQKAFFHRDVAVIEYIDGNIWKFRQARTLMKEIIDDLKAIIEEENYDDFMRELICQYIQLCEY